MFYVWKAVQFATGFMVLLSVVSLAFVWGSAQPQQGPTGHFYEVVTVAPMLNWTQARVDAETLFHNGEQGYLATITSAVENAFIIDLVIDAACIGGYLGGSDATVEGEWRWETGPEAGDQFWQGASGGTTTPPHNYANWLAGEPNNIGLEDFLTMHSTGVNAGQWNDIPDDPRSCYIVEFFGVLPPTTGGDPPIWGDIMAFPTPEKSLGQDLNGDGDTLDTVLRYKNLSTGQVTNTGLSVSNRHRDVDMYEDTIVFVEQSQYRANMISTYNIKTGEVYQTGAIGYRPTIHGSIISISGDTIRYYNLETGRLSDTGIPGNIQAIWGNTIAYHRAVREGAHPTIRFYDIETGQVTNTKVVGMGPSIYENTIAFTTLEEYIDTDLNGDGDTADSVVRFYDTDTRTLQNTGQSGLYPMIYGERIVFSTNKEIRYFDIETRQTFGTGKLGTEPDIYEDTITYYLWEDWTTTDINADGDRHDPIVRTYQISDVTKPVARPAERETLPLSAPLSISSLASAPNPVTRTSSVTFSVQGNGIEDMNVEVYDLSGKNVYSSGFSSGHRLKWNLLTDDGNTVANGVYLYIATVRGAHQEIIRSSVRKLVILR